MNAIVIESYRKKNKFLKMTTILYDEKSLYL